MPYHRALLFIIGALFPLSIWAQNPKIVINEIHCTSLQLIDKTEFIELYNADSVPIDLSFWQLQRGVNFVFPEETILPKGAYLVVVESLADFKSKINTLPANALILGNYKGRLRSEGDNIELRDASGKLIDKVSYQLGFPFPTTGGIRGSLSLQLMHPTLPNHLGGNWRGAISTPCALNQSIYAQDANVPPLIDKVIHTPKEPRANELVTITARVSDPQGIQKVELWYQLVNAGNYIRQKDAAYEAAPNWKLVLMSDNGSNGDAKANDSIFTAQVPANEQVHRRLVRYRIAATDSTNKRVRVPYIDDTQPNFAYFVYNGLPKYAGHSFDSLRPMPICHLIAKAEDVQYGINHYRGDSYNTRGTIVYNGVVYDHIGFRSRGYNNRHARPKRNLKFNFNRGHDIEVLDNYGKPYSTKRGKMVLSGTWLLDKPNTHGIAEGTLYQLFNLQGAPASQADYTHLRIIRNNTELDTMNGDFWGLYLVMENFDSDFLKTHNLPDGNIYSYKPLKMRHEGADGPFGLKNPAYVEWDTLYNHKNTMGWWLSHLDLQAYYGFVITQEAIGNKETGYRGQHWWMEYFNPVNGHWYIFPWDMDATFKSSSGGSTISSTIRNAAFSHLPLKIGYENKMRSFLDLLYNEDQTYALIDEYASFIYDAKISYSFVELDKLRWGQKYNHFSDEINALKRFVSNRRTVLLSKLPHQHPQKPTISYTGTSTYESDQLSFKCSEFQDSFYKFSAMEWRVAEVTDAQNPYYQASMPRVYEIKPVWESGELTTFGNTITLPYGAVQPNKSYRVRVRFKNSLGYYSHWSAPVQFIAKMPKETFAGKLIFTEIMYHPNEGTEVEFIEIKNISDKTIDLEGFKVAGGVKFTFPKRSYIPPQGQVVLTNDFEKFKEKYGFSPEGVYKGNLDNGGEQLILLDAINSEVDSLTYSDQLPWDNHADGMGFSLEIVDELMDNGTPQNWRVSKQQGGTPIQNVFTDQHPKDGDGSFAPNNNQPHTSSFAFIAIIGGASLLGVSFISLVWNKIKSNS